MSSVKKNRLSLSKKRKLNDGPDRSSTPTIMSMFEKQREKQTGETLNAMDESGNESDVVITKVVESRSGTVMSPHICDGESLSQHNSPKCSLKQAVQGSDSNIEGDKLHKDTQSFKSNDETVKGSKCVETSSKFKRKTRISVKEQSQRSDTHINGIMDDEEEGNPSKNSDSSMKTSEKNANMNLVESRNSPRLKAKSLSAAEAEVIVLEDDFIPPSSKKRKLTLRKAKTDSEISEMKKSCKKENLNEGTNGTILEDDVKVVGSDRDTELEEMKDLETDVEYTSGVTDDDASHEPKLKNMGKKKHRGKSIVLDQEKSTSECNNQSVSNSLRGKPKTLTKVAHKDVMNPTVLENSENKTEVTNNQDEEIDADDGGVSEDPVYQVPYYLENFHTIIDSVMEDTEYCRLFNTSDMQYITAFRELPEPCQKLFVRIFGRKLSWLPMTKLKYPGISDDIPSLVDNLITAGFLKSGEDLEDLPVLLKLLPGPELKSLAKTFHITTVNTTKPKLMELLMKKSQQSSIGSMFGGGNKASSSTLKTMVKRAKGYLGKVSCLQEDVRAVFIRVLMLFCLYNTNFDEENGNVGQNQLFQMLMVNIGRVTYPYYTVNKSKPVFKDREAVVRFETALQFEMDILHLIDRSKWDEAFVVYEQAREVGEQILKNKQYRKWDASLPEFLRLYTAGCIYIRIANQGVEILQRRKKYAAAVSLLEEMLAQKLYCNQYRGHWYERLALNLDAHLKKPAQSLDVIKRGLSDEQVRSGRKLAIYERAKKICEAPKSKFADRMKEFVHDEVVSPPETSIEGMVISDATSMGMKYQFVMQGDSDSTTFCAVEELVLEHYKNNGYPNGLHAEGSIIGNLFTLYFWDILYMDVADVFQGPFQSCPLDLYTREFYEQRKSVVDLRLEWIRQATEQDLTDEIKKIWDEHSGKMCIGLSWEKFSGPETHQGLVSCMNGQMIAGILERYVKDPRHTRSGFPDLTLWNTDTKTIKISEVKGPNDRLSYKQILWIDYLLKLGIDAEVCYVKAVGSKKLKPKSAK